MAKEFSLKNTALSMKRAKVEMHKPGYKFSVEKRIEVISTWLALGNLRQTAVLCGVSYDLCCKWRVQPWWQQMQAEIEAARKHKVDNKLNKIVDKALGAIEDRLDHGDYVYNQKSGEVSRKPVSIKEARGVANDLMQRQVALSKLEIETQHVSSNNSVKDQIALLAEEFAKFNTKRTIEVVPKENSHTVHEERPQDGEDGQGYTARKRAVQFSTGANQSTHGTQPSTSGYGEGGESYEGGWEGRGPQDSSEQGWDEREDQLEGYEPSEQQKLFEEFQLQSEKSAE